MTREAAIEQAKLYLHTLTDQHLADLLSTMTGLYHTCDGEVIRMTEDKTADVVFISEYTTGAGDTGLTCKQIINAMAKDEMPDGVDVWEGVEDYSPAELINRFYKG